MNDKEKILVFIPMYNCERQISRVLGQFRSEKIASLVDEIIIVNNRSSDDSEHVAAENAKTMEVPVKVLRNEENYGLGGSHKVAFEYAIKNGFSHVIVLHGDDQGNIADFALCLERGMHRTVDCLLGARFHEKSILPGYSTFRTFGNKVYNLLFSLVVKRSIYDLGSGLNCYKVEMLNSGFYHQFPDDLTFNYCMVLASHYYRQTVEFVPISWREDDQVSNVKLFSQAIRVLKLLGRYACDKTAFMQGEHRPISRSNYRAQVIYENTGAER